MGDRPRKLVPDGARQHKTAGPYSPVMVIDGSRIVVVSGQVAVDLDGEVVGSSIEEQTRYTLENCRLQLASAGADFTDVFKVNVYMSDLNEWARFNNVYESVLSKPYPVRTAVQAVLLPGYRVEIEMWATAKD
jgi:2-iminobutanoate/2-iminopropanoate deaminase